MALLFVCDLRHSQHFFINVGAIVRLPRLKQINVDDKMTCSDTTQCLR